MKIIIKITDLDSLYDEITCAVEESLLRSGLSLDEQEVVEQKRITTITEVLQKWVVNKQHIRLEVDTDAETCIVLPVR